MSSRKNRQNSPAADAGNAPEMTVVDGNVVGIAPTGAVAGLDGDDAIDAALAAIDAELANPSPIASSEDPVETASDVTLDPEIEAILAEEAPLTEAPVEAASTTEEVVENLEAVTADDVAAVIQNDADALLAELAADDNKAPATTKTPRKKKDPAAAATPAQTKRDFHTIAAIDAATLKTNLDGCAAQKVQEKAQNLIQAIETGKKLSRYTGIAIKRLVADGKVTGKGLVETMQGEGLGLGTARAQAQQMTALFRIAGIAAPDATAPKELVLADRGLADELVRLAA